MLTLDELLQQAFGQGARSVLFRPGGAPRIRAGDRAIDLEGPRLDDDALREVCLAALSDADRRRLAASDLTFQTVYRSTTLGPFEMRVFRFGSSIGAAFRRLSEMEAGSYCLWCGILSPGEPVCTSCRRPLGTAPGPQTAGAPEAGADPQPAPHLAQDDDPGDAAVPAVLSGPIPPRAGHDAKPMPTTPADIEPPREP